MTCIRALTMMLTLGSAALPRAQPQPPAPASQRPTRDQAPARTGTAVIRGHVVAADGGTPLRRAQVTVSSAAIREPHVTTTDGDGLYEFKDLPAGRYTLYVRKGSYVGLGYGQRSPMEPSRPLELADAQVIENVDVALPRGSVISGRIVDEFGDPVVGANVRILRFRYVPGNDERYPVPTGTASTDDTGEFRAFGLAPGEYIVSATLRPAAPGAATDTPGYPPAYYPGSLAMTDAQKITVETAVEVPNVSFALIPARMARLSGTAADSAGRPMANAMVSLRQGISTPSFAMVSSGGVGSARADGSFTIDNVVPGEYVLEVRMPNAAPGSEYAFATVSVAGSDIDGIAIVSSKGATARGQVVFEGAAPTAALRVSGSSVNGSTLSLTPGGSGDVTADGSFEVRGIFGTRTLGVSPLPSGWRVRAVMLNGADVSTTGYPFRGTEEVRGFQVILANDVTEVSGTAADDQGRPVRDYTAVIFPTDRARWKEGARYIRAARPDQSGRAVLRSVSPGEYFVAAVEWIESGTEYDPGVLDRLQRGAQRITVAPSTPASVTLTLAKP